MEKGGGEEEAFLCLGKIMVGDDCYQWERMVKVKHYRTNVRQADKGVGNWLIVCRDSYTPACGSIPVGRKSP